MATQDTKKGNATAAGASGARLRRDAEPTGSGPATSTGGGRTPAAAQPQTRRAERRPEMIKQRREERRQAYEKQRRQWLYTRIGIGVFALLAVAGIGYGVWSYVQDQNLNQRPEGVSDFQYAGGEHSSEAVQYSETPPVGGAHDPVWQNCGFYDQPVRSENAVHSLEHGAVWITYRPDLPQEQVDILREKAEQDYILVSPFEGLETPVVASSWNHQIQLDGANDERLDQFIRVFKEGPDTPEPGALCSRGVGTPV